jgi:hypothetical protein
MLERKLRVRRRDAGETVLALRVLEVRDLDDQHVVVLPVERDT